MAGDFLTGSARSSALQQPLDSNPNNRLLTGHPSSRSAPEIAQGSPKQQWLTEKDALDPDGEAVVARAGPTKLDLILNWLLQIFGITIAVLFGVFSILSYFAASQDLAVSQLANQVALLSMCLQGSDQYQTPDLCGPLLQNADVASLASQVFPSLSLPTAEPTTILSISTTVPTPSATTIFVTVTSVVTSSGATLETITTTLATITESSTLGGILPSSGEAEPTSQIPSSAGAAPSSEPGPPGSTPGGSSPQPISPGAIAGIIIGVFAVVVALLASLRFWQKWRVSR